MAGVSVFPYNLNFDLGALEKGIAEEQIPNQVGSPPSESVSEHLNQLTDTELIERLRSGSSHESIAVLFSRYRPLILSICVKILRDPFEAEDVCQDVFLQVRDMETNLPAVVRDILWVVGKELRGAVVYDRTAD